jgi:hypothetical protein
MFKLKGFYEWKLTNVETNKVEQEGNQWNVISDRFLNFLFISSITRSTAAAYNGMAILLSDSIPTPGTDYRVAGASNIFNILATGTTDQYNVNYIARSKYCDNNFSQPASPRTIRVIGIKIFNETNNYFPQPNFVSFIELSAPITQNTNQYLYVKYTVYITYSPGIGYNTPNNRYLEYGFNNNIFTDVSIFMGNIYDTYKTASFCLTSLLPPSNINYMQRGVSVRYKSILAETRYNYGSPFGVSFLKDAAVADFPGPMGAIAFVIKDQGQLTTPSTYYGFFHCTYGYSQTKTLVPSISRIFPHPAGRETQIFSDPSYPSSSVGTVSITGTPTNKYSIVGKIRITQTGDASDLVDEVVNYTAVDTGTNAIAVTQDIATGDKYRLTTTGTLPSPLVAGTDYYIIRMSSTSIKIAQTYALALAGTPIDLTTQGVGDHTLIRQNTGTYRLELFPWSDNLVAPTSGSAWMYKPWILYQLSMAIDYDGYIMPADLNSTTNIYTNYAEGDYIADNSGTYQGEFVTHYSASMVRGSIQNGSYIYTVQQSRKGLINNVCRWLFNTLETSQPLCKFGTGATKVITVLDGGTVMYICTTDGIYEYTFATPTVAPVLLTITGMIDNNITDACRDPITGYLWTGHTTGLSKIDTGALTATQYLTGAGQALEGMTANEVRITCGQLEAYNGRILRGGISYENNSYSNYQTAWVMDDGVGYYRVNASALCYSCCLRKGTSQVVYLYYNLLTLFTVTVTGKNIGSSTITESFSLASPQSINDMGAQIGQVSSDTFMWVHASGQVMSNTYKIGSAPVYYNLSYGTNSEPSYQYTKVGGGFGWAMGALKRSVIDLDGNHTYGFLWHNYLITPYIVVSTAYGWDGSAWVKDNPNSRAIPKTATHTLVNGLSVDFNNGSGSWDLQFISGECFNFVFGPCPIKDNLQTVQIKARSYVCEAHVVESYAVTVPAVTPYEITIPEASDPNFRDLDSTDYITEVYELTTPYTYYSSSAGTYTVSAATDILSVAANIPTGTAITVYNSVDINNTPYPLKSNYTYYAINISTTTIKLALSYADALTGTAINITDTGTDTQYYTIINPTTGTYRMCSSGKFKFAAADAGKNLTLTYSYTKFTV